jgi:hypothetical protein
LYIYLWNFSHRWNFSQTYSSNAEKSLENWKHGKLIIPFSKAGRGLTSSVKLCLWGREKSRQLDAGRQIDGKLIIPFNKAGRGLTSCVCVAPYPKPYNLKGDYPKLYNLKSDYPKLYNLKSDYPKLYNLKSDYPKLYNLKSDYPKLYNLKGEIFMWVYFVTLNLQLYKNTNIKQLSSTEFWIIKGTSST